MSDVQTGQAAPSPAPADPTQQTAAPQTPATPNPAPTPGTHEQQGANQPHPTTQSGWQVPPVPGLNPQRGGQQTQPPENPAAPEGEASVERVVPAADGYKLPEGAPQALGEFAHSNGFTQEQLDATMQEFGSYLSAMSQGQKQQMFDAGTAHVAGWGEAKAENVSLVKRGLAYHDKSGALTQLLNESGWLNHPVILEHFLSVGKTLQEGGFLEGETNTTRPQVQNPAHILYPNDVPKND